MAIAQIENGVVSALFRDVSTIPEARKKYPHLSVAVLVEAVQPPGMLYDGKKFTPPTPRPSPPEPPREDGVTKAIKRLAQRAGVDVSDILP